jgi:hypothetical protein
MSSIALADNGKPKYQQIAADLTGRIRGGEYPPGEALPSLAQWRGRYDVSQITVLLEGPGRPRRAPGGGAALQPPELGIAGRGRNSCDSGESIDKCVLTQVKEGDHP